MKNKMTNLEMLEELEEGIMELERAIRRFAYSVGEKLHIAEEPIRFTDVVPGRRHNDVGEYGFYSTYYPTEIVGVYEYYTSTTCEFSSCGTGFEGLVILTESEYQRLVKEEEEILRS